MGDIFQKSSTTIVWLGKEEPHPEAKWILQAFIPRFLNVFREKGRDYFVPKDPACTDPELIQFLGEEVCSRWRREFRFLFLFFIQRRWFTRGWIVQEVVLRTLENESDVVILCGSRPMLWSELLGFLESLTRTDWRRVLTKRLRSYHETTHYGFQFSDVIQRLNCIRTIRKRIQDAYHGKESELLRLRFGLRQTQSERMHRYPKLYIRFEGANSPTGETSYMTASVWYLASYNQATLFLSWLRTTTLVRLRSIPRRLGRCYAILRTWIFSTPLETRVYRRSIACRPGYPTSPPRHSLPGSYQFTRHSAALHTVMPHKGDLPHRDLL